MTQIHTLSLALQRTAVRRLVQLPMGVVKKLAGKPIIIDGQTLDTRLQMLLRLFAPAPNHLVSVAETRAEFDEQGAWLAGAGTDQVCITDQAIPIDDTHLTLRLYTPISHQDQPLPALIFYHGGGYVAGSLTSHDIPCQQLATAVGCAVIAVNYRLAPEHPFPTPVNDGIAAFRYIVRHADSLGVDSHRLAVGGDSAGGNLAAVVAQQTKHDPISPILQILWVPWVDMSTERHSYELFATGFFLERAKMRWYTQHYLASDADKTNPLASPIYGDTTGVAPAHIIVGGFDPLRDEGIDYAHKLQANGVKVSLRICHSLPHPIINIAV